LGLKIKFKGRFNKWKRTKKWEAQAGNLLVQSYDSLIDYSSIKGLVKKGIFSIRLWIQFKKNSKFALKKKMNSFFQYSIFKQKLTKNESYSS
jgi:ribosomal protein S3